MASPTLASPMHFDAHASDEEKSLELAHRFQREEEEETIIQDEGVFQGEDGGGDPELDASLALAIQMQREFDEAQLRDALTMAGALPDDDDDERQLSPSQLDFDQLSRLADTVGKVTRGVSVEALGAMRVLSFEACECEGAPLILNSQCTICQLSYEGEDAMRVLPCNHVEHRDCVDIWFRDNKACPVCKADVQDLVDATAGSH